MDVARALGAELLALELDEVSPGLRCESGVLLLEGDGALESHADQASEAIVEAAKANGLSALLVGETRFGTIVAAQVAAKMRVSSLGRGRAVRVEEGSLVLERDVYAGKFVAKVRARLPCVATVQAGAYRAAGSQPGSTKTMKTLARSRIEVLEAKTDQTANAGIESASIIVSAGRGFARQEDLQIAKELADALGGALGGSRPLSSELGWLSEDAHIGLTGAYVHPDLYVAIGISGQLQHVAGIKDSKVIVAINKDRQAPIFQVADYGIVGDLYEVVPALTRLLKK